MNPSTHKPTYEIPSHSSGVADILNQSRTVLYGPQDSYDSEVNDQEHISQISGSMNNTTDGTGITLQPQASDTSFGSNTQTMPPWAADICNSLQSIQRQLKDQLQTQNTRWQQIENQMTNQNTRMTRIESEIAQMSEL